MKRVLIDHTHPEDEGITTSVFGTPCYEYQFAVRDIDAKPDQHFEGPVGIVQEDYFTFPDKPIDQWTDAESDEHDEQRWGSDPIVFTATVPVEDAEKLFKELTPDQQLSILQFCVGNNDSGMMRTVVGDRADELADEFTKYDCHKWTIIFTVMKLWKCESVWWLHN